MATSPDYQFSEDDYVHAVFCIGCRTHIPKAVSEACNGLCPVCIAKINQPQVQDLSKPEFPENIQRTLDKMPPEKRQKAEAFVREMEAKKLRGDQPADKLKALADKMDRGANNMQSTGCACMTIPIMLVVIYLILAFLRSA